MHVRFDKLNFLTVIYTCQVRQIMMRPAKSDRLNSNSSTSPASTATESERQEQYVRARARIFGGDSANGKQKYGITMCLI